MTNKREAKFQKSWQWEMMTYFGITS